MCIYFLRLVYFTIKKYSRPHIKLKSSFTKLIMFILTCIYIYIYIYKFINEVIRFYYYFINLIKFINNKIDLIMILKSKQQRNIFAGYLFSFFLIKLMDIKKKSAFILIII
jgi:hypothetical protein